MATLEFTLDADDVARLVHWPGMRPNRSFAVDMVWHDTPGGVLAGGELSLVSIGPVWRLAALRGNSPGAIPSIRAEARQADLLGLSLTEPLAPLIGFTGRRQPLRWSEADGGDAVSLGLLNGRLGARLEACRLTLDGPAHALPQLAIGLAAELGLRVPLAGLGALAVAAARGEAVTPRALGAPQVGEGLRVSESLAVIVGHLLDVMLHWASVVPATRTPEAVHQMRVATRRLRSALSVYKQVAACPEVAALSAPLKICAARLGTARDWDVFLDGLGAKLAASFPDDPRCSAMLKAAGKRRRAAYVDLRTFLAGPDFRTLTVALACAATLRPWDATAATEGLQQDTAAFAAGVLARRMKRVRQSGRGIGRLSVPALHELRKDCKRLRYAAEFFASLYSQKRTKRFLQRLSDLQEELGLLNDSAAVSGLMAQLGRLERSYAAGLVEGFSAAHAGPARARIEAAWKRFRGADLFWTS